MITYLLHGTTVATNAILTGTGARGDWGAPFERPAELVARDVDRGLVTTTGARRYRVVLRTDLTIDKAATTTLRAQLSKVRGECSLFNFGGTVAELKASSKADTGFGPPTNRISRRG